MTNTDFYIMVIKYLLIFNIESKVEIFFMLNDTLTLIYCSSSTKIFSNILSFNTIVQPYRRVLKYNDPIPYKDPPPTKRAILDMTLNCILW